MIKVSRKALFFFFFLAVIVLGIQLYIIIEKLIDHENVAYSSYLVAAGLVLSATAFGLRLWQKNKESQR